MDEYAQIRFKINREHKSQRQVAKEMGISRNTVAKYADGNHYPGEHVIRHRASSIVTPEVKSFVQGCLDADANEPNRKQHHTARRIYHRLVDEAGFRGGESTIRLLVRQMREKSREAFVPLEFPPGDTMQIDWGECDVIIGGERVKVYTFCARLCFSCAPFVTSFRRQNTEAFLEGILRAFKFFGGVPRRVHFDNARVAVKSGSGKTAVCREEYEAFAAHYCFRPEFCNVRKGNEKGLVENLVGFSRRNMFVPLPNVQSIEALNEILMERCEDYISNHKIKERFQRVAEMLNTERVKLLPLPGTDYDTSKTTECRVSRYASVRFDTNNYSVPVRYTGEIVAVKGSAETVTIYIDGEIIAKHPRNYAKHQNILSLAHYLPLLERKPRSMAFAKPVRMNLSPALLHLLDTTGFNDKELMDILTICANEGENAFWQQLPEHLLNHFRPEIRDKVSVAAVNLTDYDGLISEREGVCRVTA